MSWHALVLYSLLRLKNSPLYGYATFCLSFYPLTGTWVVSVFCAAVNMGVYMDVSTCFNSFGSTWEWNRYVICYFFPASSVTTAGPPTELAHLGSGYIWSKGEEDQMSSPCFWISFVHLTNIYRALVHSSCLGRSKTEVCCLMEMIFQLQGEMDSFRVAGTTRTTKQNSMTAAVFGVVRKDTWRT